MTETTKLSPEQIATVLARADELLLKGTPTPTGPAVPVGLLTYSKEQ